MTHVRVAQVLDGGRDWPAILSILRGNVKFLTDARAMAMLSVRQESSTFFSIGKNDVDRCSVVG